MDVVFEGAISRSWGMSDVLRGVMAVENQRFGILRISSPGSNVSGRLAIQENQYIVGGLLSDGSELGYHAVRRLLSATDGNFAYLDTGGKKPQDFDQGLFISLVKLSETWPELPTDANDLFDEKALLDRVFGGDEEPLAPTESGRMPVVQEVEPRSDRPTRASLVREMQENAATNSNSRMIAASSEVELDLPPPPPRIDVTRQTSTKPLLSNSLVEGAQTISGGYPELDEMPVFERPTSAMRLRVAPDSEINPPLKKLMASKDTLLWISAVTIITLLAIFVATGSLSKHNSITIHRNTADRTQP